MKVHKILRGQQGDWRARKVVCMCLSWETCLRALGYYSSNITISAWINKSKASLQLVHDMFSLGFMGKSLKLENQHFLSHSDFSGKSQRKGNKGWDCKLHFWKMKSEVVFVVAVSVVEPGILITLWIIYMKYYNHPVKYLNICFMDSLQIFCICGLQVMYPNGFSSPKGWPNLKKVSLTTGLMWGLLKYFSQSSNSTQKLSPNF